MGKGDDIIFNISFKDNTLMVNRTDLTGMIGADKARKTDKPSPKAK